MKQNNNAWVYLIGSLAECFVVELAIKASKISGSAIKIFRDSCEYNLDNPSHNADITIEIGGGAKKRIEVKFRSQERLELKDLNQKTNATHLAIVQLKDDNLNVRVYRKLNDLWTAIKLKAESKVCNGTYLTLSNVTIDNLYELYSLKEKKCKNDFENTYNSLCKRFAVVMKAAIEQRDQ